MKLPITILSVALAGAALADFSYNDFSNTNGLQLNGVAAQATSANNDPVLRLTGLNFGTAGNAWYTTQQNVSGGFSTDFTIRAFDGQFDNGDGTFGDGHGDGFAFALTTGDTSQIGSGGDNNAMRDIVTPGGHTVGVDFRTFWGGIQFFVDGNVISDVPMANITSDATHNLHIDYAGGIWNVSIDGVAAMTQAFDLSGFGPATVGIGSGTGAADDNNDIYNWNFKNNAVPEPCSMAALALGIGALLRRRARQS